MFILSLSSISRANCPWILFAVHSFFLCSPLVFLNSLGSTISSFVIVLLFLTVTSHGSILFLTYQPRPFSSLLTLFLHPIRSLPPFFPRNIQPCYTTSWVQSFIHYHKFPGLSVHFLQFIPIPFKYSSTIPHNGDCSMFSAIILFPQFSLLFKIIFSLLKYSFLNLSFISCSFILSYSNIPRCLYPSYSISLIFSPLGNFVPSVDLTFPLLISITSHFLIPNYMPMS